MWDIQKIVSKGQYEYAVVPEHPKATKHGYVLLHRIVMENYLGRLLEDDEIVHHIKEDEKKNNDIDNLELCLDYIHSKYHAKKGRTYVTLICNFCGEEFQREIRQMYKKKQKGIFCGRPCFYESMRK
jgi:hypothetical protein